MTTIAMSSISSSSSIPPPSSSSVDNSNFVSATLIRIDNVFTNASTINNAAAVAAAAATSDNHQQQQQCDDQYKILHLNLQTVMLGRSSRCNIVIKSLDISREHAKFVFKHGRWYIIDLSSTNGIWIDHNRIISDSNDRTSSNDELRNPLRNGAILCFGPNVATNTFKYTFFMNSTEYVHYNLNINNNSSETNHTADTQEQQSTNVDKNNNNTKLTVSSSPPPTTALIDSILNNLTCTICTEYFIDPCVLNCGHTFCHYCIHIWQCNATYSPSSRTYSSLCPICRTKIFSVSPILAFKQMVEDVLETQAKHQQQQQAIDHHNQSNVRITVIDKQERLRECERRRLAVPPYRITHIIPSSLFVNVLDNDGNDRMAQDQQHEHQLDFDSEFDDDFENDNEDDEDDDDDDEEEEEEDEEEVDDEENEDDEEEEEMPEDYEDEEDEDEEEEEEEEWNSTFRNFYEVVVFEQTFSDDDDDDDDDDDEDDYDVYLC